MQIKKIKIDEIIIGDNIRNSYDVTELANSIKIAGLLNPIVVSRKEVFDKDNKSTIDYYLVAGHRRYYACKNLNYKEITCSILENKKSDIKTKFIQLIENIQREDLTNLEYARAVVDLWETGAYSSKTSLARELGKSSSYVSKCFKINKDLVVDNKDDANKLSISTLDEVARKHKDVQSKVVFELADGAMNREELRAFDKEIVDIPIETEQALDKAYGNEEISPAKKREEENSDVIYSETLMAIDVLRAGFAELDTEDDHILSFCKLLEVGEKYKITIERIPNE